LEKKRAIKRCGPNPLIPAAVVAVETERVGRMRVLVFDVHGRMVRVLANEAKLTMPVDRVPTNQDFVFGGAVSPFNFFSCCGGKTLRKTA
jgi:hypothetical protein